MSIMVTRSSMPSLEEYIEEIKPIFESRHLTNMGPVYQKLQAQVRDTMLDAAKKAFRPELLNRFDAQIVFRRLEKDDIVKIVEIELKSLRARLAAQGLTLELSRAAMDDLASVGLDPAYGARPLRRAIENRLEDPLADAMLRGRFEPPCTISVTPGKDGKAFAFKTRRAKPEAPTGA